MVGHPVTPQEADALWAVLDIGVYRMLTAPAGVDPGQYQDWLAGAIDRLLDGGPATERRAKGGTTMAKRLARTCRVEVEVAAPAEAVWRVIADVTRTGEWSHECHRVDLARRGDVGRAGRSLPWRQQGAVVAVEPDQRGHRGSTPDASIAWRTIPTWRFVDSTEWRITLEPLSPGTRIVQTYHVVRCPRWWEWLVAHVIPPHRDRSAALAADIRRLGDVAAADVAHPAPTTPPPP